PAHIGRILPRGRNSPCSERIPSSVTPMRCGSAMKKTVTILSAPRDAIQRGERRNTKQDPPTSVALWPYINALCCDLLLSASSCRGGAVRPAAVGAGDCTVVGHFSTKNVTIDRRQR